MFPFGDVFMPLRIHEHPHIGWVYRRIQSGEIPSVKRGRNIVRREDLERYLKAQRYHPVPGEVG